MTLKQQKYHKSLIKAVHLSLKYSNYYKEERTEYEELLMQHFGKRSSKELQIDQLIMLIDYLNHKRSSLPVQKGTYATARQLTTIRGLWEKKASTPTDETLLIFIEKIIKKRYLHLHMLTLEEGKKIIYILKQMKTNGEA